MAINSNFLLGVVESLKTVDQYFVDVPDSLSFSASKWRILCKILREVEATQSIFRYLVV